MSDFEALVERVRAGVEAEPFMLGKHSAALAALTELAERLKRAEERWQELEHPFDKAEFDAMAERLKAAEDERDIWRQNFETSAQMAEAAERERDNFRDEAAEQQMRWLEARDQRDELVEAVRAAIEMGLDHPDALETLHAPLRAKVRGEAE